MNIYLKKRGPVMQDLIVRLETESMAIKAVVEVELDSDFHWTPNFGVKSWISPAGHPGEEDRTITTLDADVAAFLVECIYEAFANDTVTDI